VGKLMKELDNRTYPIREDMAFQQRSWLLERIGWIVLALVGAAALAGVFFHGPASYARARNADNSLSVDYERFAHKTAMTYFTVRATAPVGDELMVRLSPSLMDIHDIESIEPHPLRARGGTYGLELVFARSGAGDVAFHIAARPKRFGTMSLHLEAEGRSSLNIFQLIYP
jgi:hypothetical protein